MCVCGWVGVGGDISRTYMRYVYMRTGGLRWVLVGGGMKMDENELEGGLLIEVVCGRDGNGMTLIHHYWDVFSTVSSYIICMLVIRLFRLLTNCIVSRTCFSLV